MTPERWEQIKQIFEAALERKPAQRAAYIEEACRADSELRAEVENLLSGETKASSFLENPALAIFPSSSMDGSVPTFAARDTVSGRFRVVRFIGKGGMGEVYEAEDLELGERVALKIIRPEISADRRILARFKHEIQLARRVTHPNVCRMFDIERHTSSPGPDGAPSGEISFLTMELLEGETLAARLKRQGRFSTVEAFPLVEQMAEGLAAAHAAAVIHRDFKPANVVLVDTPKGTRVVVTDFGLARVAETGSALSATDLSSSLTSTGHILGTPAYMAPEQLEGGEVSPATDIYNLGLVMYEMVAGSRPFTNDAPFAGAFKRVKELPPSPRTLVPDLDSRWEATIMRCLAIDPAGRFTHAREVIAALTGRASPTAPSASSVAQIGASGKLHPLPGESLIPGILSYRWLTRYRIPLGAVTLVVLVALLAWRFRLGDWGGKPQIAAGSSVLLTNVENETKDPELNGVTELLQNQLAQSAYFNLVSPGQIREALQRMVRPAGQKLDAVTAREVAWRNGAPLVIFGSISSLAQEYTLALRMERVGNDPNYDHGNWTQTWHASSKREIFDAVREASRWAREKIGEGIQNVANSDRPPQDVTTDSWEALGLLTKARQLNSEDKPEDAILLLKESVEKDPQFALGYMSLGDLMDSRARFSEGYAAWRKALSIMGARKLSEREALRIKGLFAMDTGDLNTAEATFATYSIHFPHDYLGWFYRAYPLMMLGRPQEAIQTLLEAERQQPSSFYPPYHLACYNLILGNYKATAQYVARIRALDHGHAADYVEGESSFLQGDYQKALDFFARLKDCGEPYYETRSYYLRACVLAELGKCKEAAQSLRDGIDADVPSGRPIERAAKWLGLAYLALRRGDRRECQKDCLNALDLDKSLQCSLAAGTLLARAGFVADAHNTLSKLDAGDYPPISEIVRHRLAGEILLAQNQPKQAVADFEKASTFEPPTEPREYLAQALMAEGKPDAALVFYERAAQSPGQIWEQAELHPPGLWGDSLLNYARVALSLGKPEGKASLNVYLRLHANADSDDPGLIEALRLQRNSSAKNQIQ